MTETTPSSSSPAETFNFDDQFQMGILELMMQDGDFAYKCSYLLKPHYFKNNYYGWFFETMSKLFGEFQQPPTPMQLVNEMMRLKESERPPYAALFEKMVRPSKMKDYGYIRSRLQHFVKRAKMWQINRKMVESKFTDPDALYEYASKEIQEFDAISFDRDEFLTPLDADKAMMESADSSKNLVSLGLPSLDEAMGGGVPVGTLTTALGGTNVGKSIWLVNVAKHVVKTGHRALYINLEGVKNQPLLRLIASGIQVPYGRVRFNKLNEVETAKKKQFVDEIKDRLQIKHVNSFGYTVEELYSYCRTKKDTFDFDVLLVDYGQLLFSKQKHEGLRHMQAYVHRCLASIASSMNIAVITVAQGTRDVQGKNRKGNELLRMDDISECFEISRVSAQVITLNRSEMDEVNNRVRILLDKQRDGRKGVVEICRSNFSHVSMYGSAEEGLGFISQDEYLAEELSTEETASSATT